MTKSINSKWGLRAALSTAAVLAVALVAAQDFRMGAGQPNRTGIPTVSASTGATPATTYNNPGRSFLRWWNPVLSQQVTLDNDQTINTPPAAPHGVAVNMTGVWENPSNIGLANLAFGFVNNSVSPYRIIRSVAQTAGSTDPRTGATGRYQWRFSNLTPGKEYQLFFNMPVGPSSISATNVTADDFPQRYYVLDVTDGTGSEIQILDLFSVGGGMVRLGDNGLTTNQVYIADGSGAITINLYNTTPRRSDGTFMDGGARPGQEWVYADAAFIDSTIVSTGGYVAAPIVSELSGSTAPAVSSARHRTVAARNEVLVSGRLNDVVAVGSVSSYIYDGTLANALQPDRLNVGWSWPVKRAIDTSTAENQRYNLDRENWIYGPVAGNERHTARYAQDNRNAKTFVAGVGFTPQSGLTTFNGVDYLAAPVQVGPTIGSATGEVRYQSTLPEGKYFVQVWMPDADTGATVASQALYRVQNSAGNVILELNQSTASGWVTLPGQPTDGFDSGGAFGDLEVTCFNVSRAAGDAGKVVYTDAVRFIKTADLSITSTPVHATTQIQVGASTTLRDAIVAPMEDGRIYCIDAVGNTTTGDAPATFWTYPSNNPATDPNAALAEDGKSAVMPTGFNRSSGFVANVGGVDYFYILSENGRVYCIEMQGRGDGTTRRRWTWPDDYDPTNGTDNGAMPLAAGKGSITLGDVAGTPAIIVTGADGKVYMLDAAGIAATKRTTVLMTSSVTLGEIHSTPVYAFGRIYVCAPSNPGSPTDEVFCFNPAIDTDANALTLDVEWQSSLTAVGTFAPFNESSPVAITAAEMIGGGPNAGQDAVIVCDSAGRLVSIDPATGAQRWQTTEVVSGSHGSLGFAYMTVFDGVAAGSTTANSPTVLIPTNGGSVVGLFADGTTNVAGTHRNYQYDLEGGPGTNIATGGWRAGDFRSWMYCGDALGNLYAFNGNDDVNPNPITPGRQPGIEVIVENDAAFSDLVNLIDPDKVRLIDPRTYELMNQEINDGTLTPAKVAAYILAGTVDRRVFEVGETLYVVVYDLDDLSASSISYTIEVIMSSAGNQQRRQVAARNLGIAPGADSKIMLLPYPILPTTNGGIAPGTVDLKVRSVAQGRRVPQTSDIPLRAPGGVGVAGQFQLANPMALYFPVVGNTPGVGQSGVGNTTIAGDPHTIENGSLGIDPVGGFISGPVKESAGAIQLPGGYVGPTVDRAGDGVAHGSTGAMRMQVRDRSLSFLIYGLDRGLPGVRLASEDVVWQVRTGGVIQPHRNRYKPLTDNTGAVYPGFEDDPTLEPNRSLDYPNISRSSLSGAKSKFGRTENPYFIGVTLEPPTYTPANRTTYYTKAGYEAQMVRNLSDTTFDLEMSVPKYQPASGPSSLAMALRPGYKGRNFVYLDTGLAGFQVTETHRSFGLGTRVAPDERLSTTTPTVDLGSQPAGAGFGYGAATGNPGVYGPENPWNGASQFRPDLGVANSMYQSFSVLNEGNVNLLNVRVSKAFDRANAAGTARIFRPIELYSPALHELAWLDGTFNLFSSLDPLYSSTGPSRMNSDPEARMILQKARPGDTVATRLSTNPFRRSNPNLAVSSGPLFSTAVIAAGDPKVGVATPIGTPVGEYIRKIYAFEDTIGSNGATPQTPSLGPRATGGFLSDDDVEAFTDPGFTLKFIVRESRLTNRPTTKAAPNIDNLVTGAENHFWYNSQPSAMRLGDGRSVVAFTSNRRDAANLPNVLARPKTDADSSDTDNPRIYLTGLTGTSPLAPGNGQSPLSDLNGWSAFNAGRFHYGGVVLPDAATGTAAAAFAPPVGTTVDPNTVRFGAPSFPTAGGFNPLESSTGIKNAQTTRFITYVGEAEVRDDSGTPKTISQIMLTSVDFNVVNGFGIVSHSTMPHDPYTRKSAPTVVQQTANAATVFYTAYSGGGAGQLMFSTYIAGTWTQPRAFVSNSTFERVGSPSSTLRRFKNGFTAAGEFPGRVEVAFTAKRKGRANAEGFLARFSAGPAGSPAGRDPQVPFGPRIDEITLDPNTGKFWSPGAYWRLLSSDIDPTTTSYIDIYRLQGGAFVSILDQTTRALDAESGLMTYSTTLGGKITVDTTSGGISMSNVLLPRGVRLFVRYAPYYMQISNNDGLNYRSASMVFDDRLIGVYTNAADPVRNLIGDIAYWFDSIGARPATNSLIRNDRVITAFTRTGTDGSLATRPSMKSIRFGVQLPLAIAVNSSGAPLGFTIDWTNGPSGAIPANQQVPAAERYYQIDPANGRVYFLSSGEGRQVTISYQAVDSAGRVMPMSVPVTFAIDIVTETSEQLIPIEQAPNETGLSLSLDPSNTAFNDVNVRRPGLLWLFWTSTRSGGPDVYFETIAPRFSPKPPVP